MAGAIIFSGLGAYGNIFNINILPLKYYFDGNRRNRLEIKWDLCMKEQLMSLYGLWLNL